MRELEGQAWTEALLLPRCEAAGTAVVGTWESVAAVGAVAPQVCRTGGSRSLTGASMSGGLWRHWVSSGEVEWLAGLPDWG